MEYQKDNKSRQIPQGKKLDAQELNRLLMRYQGIFKNNIKEFANRNSISKPKKNFAR